uniref:uncharacterized protein LOC120336954 n=1 Tax=Styela clava TaxID=7725 RepID=UPI00193A8CE2|nr:uncharacterized protein LOC120336954 [Styela clava]
MNRILLFGIILLSTIVSSLNGKKCSEYIDIRDDLSGRVESPTNYEECQESKMHCSWKFFFPTYLHHTMFRMTFTTNFVQTDKNLIQMSGGFQPRCLGCSRKHYINFKSVKDEICWVTYNSDLCFGRIMLSGCNVRPRESTRHTSQVTPTSVSYICKPSKAQFNLSYEYIDCMTGNRIESPETTTQPTTYEPIAENSKDDLISLSPQTIGIIIGAIVLAFVLQIITCKAYFYWKNRNRRPKEGENQINTRVVNRPLPDPPSDSLYEEVNIPLSRTEAGATPQITIPMDYARYIAHTNVNTSRPRNNQAFPQPAMASSSQGGYAVARM